MTEALLVKLRNNAFMTMEHIFYKIYVFLEFCSCFLKVVLFTHEQCCLATHVIIPLEVCVVSTHAQTVLIASIVVWLVESPVRNNNVLQKKAVPCPNSMNIPSANPKEVISARSPICIQTFYLI